MRAIQMVRPEARGVSYGDDVEVPTPGPGEVRVRVARTAICGTDRHIYHWDESISHLVRPPVTIGHEFCGYIDAVGDGVETWSEGDYVSAEMHIVCGHCRACLRGDFHVCEHAKIAGLQASRFRSAGISDPRNLLEEAKTKRRHNVFFEVLQVQKHECFMYTGTSKLSKISNCFDSPTSWFCS